MAPGAAGQAPVGRYRVLSKAVLKASADLDSAKVRRRAKRTAVLTGSATLTFGLLPCCW